MLKYSLILDVIAFYLLLSSLVVTVLTHDQERSLRVRREPAVWGDKAPDYSEVRLGQTPFYYIYALLFVDEKIAQHYDYDLLRVKSEIIKVVKEANTYFNQLRIGIVVVDVLPTMRSDLSLYSFQEYRNEKHHLMPTHDFAVLLSYHYAGGLAFVDGMCSGQAVMLCGFFPADPSVMGSIFFHEVAHLVGVPHRPANQTLYVPNCACPLGTISGSATGCLKIPGFDHDCTAQQFANVIYKNKCLRTKPMKTKSIPICGNGVVEAGEQCDCGLLKQCYAFNCEPETCTYRMHPGWMYLVLSGFVLATFTVLLLILRYKGCFSKLAKMNCFKPQQKYKSKGFMNPGTLRNFQQSPYQHRKEFPPKTTDPSSIVVLLDGAPRAATIQRPKMPPPPPPPKATLSVDPGPNFYDIPGNQAYSNRDDISWKFEDFDSESDEEPTNQLTYSSYRAQPGVPTCPSYPPFSPINRVTVQFHGSGDTMETEVQSSASSSSGLNGTSL